MEFCQKGWTEEEKSNLLKEFGNVKYRMVFEFCYWFAMRPSEALRIKITDFKEGGWLCIPKQKNRKMNEMYPIPKEFAPKIKAYLMVFKEDIEKAGGWLFFSKNGGGMTRSTYNNYFHRARERAGLASAYMVAKNGRKFCRLSPHACKAMRVREIYRKTGSERVTQALAHHKHPLSTARYLGNPMDDLELKKKSMDSL